MSKRENDSVDRRRFLRTAAAGVVTLAVGGGAWSAPAVSSSVPASLRIDIHAHYYPTAYIDMLVRFGSKGTQIARFPPGGDKPGEMEARFRMMDRAGVKMQVLSASPQFPYFDNRNNAVSAARYINDAYADIVKRYPSRFVAFAVTPLPHVDASLEEMARALDKLGMVGVTIGTTIQERAIIDPMFDPFWTEMNRRGTILFVHPMGVGACSPQVQAGGLTWPIGAPIEDTLAVAQLVQKEIPLRYPRIRIVVSHLGGALPLIIQRLDNQAGMFMPHNATEKPSETARRMWYDTVSHAFVPALRCACEALGTDRLVLGSDFPYEKGEVYQRCVDYVRDVGLSREQAEAILDRNAQALLHLPATPATR
jgi:6-methylsalicylate decarboxylase